MLLKKIVLVFTALAAVSCIDMISRILGGGGAIAIGLLRPTFGPSCESPLPRKKEVWIGYPHSDSRSRLSSNLFFFFSFSFLFLKLKVPALMLPVQEGNERIRISMSLHVACRSEMDHRESYCAEDLNSFYRPPFSSCHLGGSRSLSAGNLVCKTATTFLSSFF
jgi:hypothetical protein